MGRRILRGGGVIAYPTEAVWGLGCDPWNAQAVQRLVSLKGRSFTKGLILVCSRLEMIEPLLKGVSSSERELLESSWPGFHTWILPHNNWVPSTIYGKNKGVAVRVSAHPVVKALSEEFGGCIVSTSANPAGAQPAKTRLKLRQYFGEAIDYVLPGELGGESQPSPLQDLRTKRILR